MRRVELRFCGGRAVYAWIPIRTDLDLVVNERAWRLLSFRSWVDLAYVLRACCVARLPTCHHLQSAHAVDEARPGRPVDVVANLFAVVNPIDLELIHWRSIAADHNWITTCMAAAGVGA